SGETRVQEKREAPDVPGAAQDRGLVARAREVTPERAERVDGDRVGLGRQEAAVTQAAEQGRSRVAVEHRQDIEVPGRIEVPDEQRRGGCADGDELRSEEPPVSVSLQERDVRRAEIRRDQIRDAVLVEIRGLYPGRKSSGVVVDGRLKGAVAVGEVD